jgi:hypothetical protein
VDKRSASTDSSANYWRMRYAYPPYIKLNLPALQLSRFTLVKAQALTEPFCAASRTLQDS